MLDLGKVKPGSTIRIPFPSFNAAGASVTMTDYAVADILVYKNGGTTQRASTSGFTATADFDAQVGAHFVIVDLADDDTGDFYEAGAEYHIWVDAVTIDGQTVGFWAARFLIGYEGSILDTTIATLASQSGFTLDGGSADNSAYHGCVALIHDKASAIQVAFGIIEDYTGSSKTVGLAKDPGVFTIAAGDNISLFPAYVSSVWDMKLTGSKHNISTSSGKRLRQIEEAFTLASGVIATVTDGHTFTLDTGAVDTAEFYEHARLMIIEGTGAGQSRIITGYTSGRVCTLDSDFVTNPDTASLYEIVSADVHVSISSQDLANGFIAAAGSTTSVTLDGAAVATTDFYKGELLVITHGTGTGQAREITAYTSGRVCTLSPALVVALDTTSVYHVTAAADIGEIATEIWGFAFSELAQGQPSATPTSEAALMLMFMALRNKIDVTSTTLELHNDAGTVIAKKALTDDGATYSEAKMVSGP